MPKTKTSQGAPDPGRTRLTGHKIKTALGIQGGATDRRRYDTIVHSRQTKDRFTPAHPEAYRTLYTPGPNISDPNIRDTLWPPNPKAKPRNKN